MQTYDFSHLQTAWSAIGRPLFAYCVACLAAATMMFLLDAIFESSGFTTDYLGLLPVIALVIAVFCLLPVLLAAAILLRTRVPRGIGETCLGAFLGPALSFVFIYSPAVPLGTILYQLATFSLMGAVAGLVYWLLVGCPRNPRATARRPSSSF